MGNCSPASAVIKSNFSEFTEHVHMVTVRIYYGDNVKLILNDPTICGLSTQKIDNIMSLMPECTSLKSLSGGDKAVFINELLGIRLTTIEYARRHGLYLQYGKYYYGIDAVLDLGGLPIRCRYDKLRANDVKVILRTLTAYHFFPYYKTELTKTDNTFILWVDCRAVAKRYNTKSPVDYIEFKAATEPPMIVLISDNPPPYSQSTFA